MLASESFDHVVHKVGACGNQHINIAAPNHVSHDLPHSCWNHGAGEAKKARDVFSLHFFVYFNSLR
jgi:hypothetical protein